MACLPIHVNLKLEPSATEKVIFILDKTCDAHDQATWRMTFELQEGSPLFTVVDFSLEIDSEIHPQAEANAMSSLAYEPGR